MKPGWRQNKLGEVCSFLNRGIAPKYIESGGVCVLNQKCIRDHRVGFDLSRRHDEVAKKVPKERFIQPGDVLVNSTGTGTLGRVAQLREAPPEQATVDSHVTIVRPLPGRFYNDFFGYMMILIEGLIKEAGEGCGGQTELSRTTLAEAFNVRYPDSIEEQKRIVDFLDDAFERIDTALANTEKNLANARELFDNYLNSIFSERKGCWKDKKLGDPSLVTIIDGDRGKNYPQKADFSTSGFCLFLNTKNVRPDGFNFDNLMFVTKEKDEQLRKGKLKRRDVVLTTRGTIGNLALYDESVPFDHVRINSGMLIFRPNESAILSEYLFEILRSGIVKNQIALYSTGAAQPQLPIKILSNFLIPVPTSVEEQRHIVSKIHTLCLTIEELTSTLNRKFCYLNELKQSLLQKAFSGELTTDFNPEALEH